MTVEDALRRGMQCEEAGDLDGADAAYREADELGDAEGAILFGLVRKRRGDTVGATAAFGRAEARGHREAACCLGNLLSDGGDIAGATAAYERGIAAGSADARLNLGLMLAQAGEVDEALRHLRVAQDSGDAVASWAIGKLLEGRGDLDGAAAAYGQAADSGDTRAAFNLAAVQALIGADAARQYVGVCAEVLAAANACLDPANRAIAAREVAGQRPQHEISIQTFTHHAEEAEREFAPLYRRFAELCDQARDAAARLVATQRTPFDAETLLAVTVEQSALDVVATVRGLLLAAYGPTPSAFVQGVDEANRLMQQPAEGLIYRPPPSASDDRYDVFISYASQDREEVARPLAELLTGLGVRVWYDEFVFQVGYPLRRTIDAGLAGSRFGIVVLSPHFFGKEWPNRELDGLVAKEQSGIILPLWHRVSKDEVMRYSPTLADTFALRTADQTLGQIAQELYRRISASR
jgi:tetratricopeptide (TPR) repeat protein